MTDIDESLMKLESQPSYRLGLVTSRLAASVEETLAAASAIQLLCTVNLYRNYYRSSCPDKPVNNEQGFYPLPFGGLRKRATAHPGTEMLERG